MNETLRLLQERANAHRQKLAERANRRAKLKKDRREKSLERFGLDVAGDPAAVADARRLMRNARKKERRLGH